MLERTPLPIPPPKTNRETYQTNVCLRHGGITKQREPEQRPDFESIVERLQALIEQHCPEFAQYDKVLLHLLQPWLSNLSSRFLIYGRVTLDGNWNQSVLRTSQGSHLEGQIFPPPPSSDVSGGATTNIDIQVPPILLLQPSSESDAAVPLDYNPPLSAPPGEAQAALLSSMLNSTQRRTLHTSKSTSNLPSVPVVMLPEAASLNFPYASLQNPASFFSAFQRPLRASASSLSAARHSWLPLDDAASSSSFLQASSSSSSSSLSSTSVSPSSPSSPLRSSPQASTDSPRPMSAYPYLSLPYPFPFPLPSPYLPPFPSPFPPGTHSHELAQAKDDPLQWSNER